MDTGQNCFLSSIGEKEDGKVWNIADGTLRHSVPGLPELFLALKDDRHFLGAKFKGVYFLDAYQQGFSPLNLSRHCPGKKGLMSGDDCWASGGLSTMAMERSGNLVALGTMGRHSKLGLFRLVFDWDNPRLELLAVAGHDNPIEAIQLSESDESLFVVDQQGDVSKWSVPELKKIQTITGNFTRLSKAEFSQDSEWVALAGSMASKKETDKRSIALINLSTGRSAVYPAAVSSVHMEFLPTLRKLMVIQGGLVSNFDY